MESVTKHIAWIALAVTGLGATVELTPASAQNATPERSRPQQHRPMKHRRQAARAAQDQQQLIQQQQFRDQQRQAYFQQQQWRQPRYGYGYGPYDQYGCPPGTGYSVFLGRCGDLSEFFTQFQGR